VAIEPLQHISAAPSATHQIGVIDIAVAEGLHRLYGAFDGKACGQGGQVLRLQNWSIGKMEAILQP
jgi:hypothetical protein